MYDKRYMVENFAKLCGENQRVVFQKQQPSLKTVPLPNGTIVALLTKKPPPKLARHFDPAYIYVSYSQDDDKKFATENAFRDVSLFMMRFE